MVEREIPNQQMKGAEEALFTLISKCNVISVEHGSVLAVTLKSIIAVYIHISVLHSTRHFCHLDYQSVVIFSYQ